MTDFTAIRPYSYADGALIDPDENNPNENTIYSKFNASMHATLGHTHDGTAGNAPKLGASSLDLAANYSWTGIHSFQTSELKLGDSDATNHYIFAGSNLAADRTVTLPLLVGNDTFVFESHAATLANKTLTSPIITGNFGLNAGGTIGITSGQRFYLDGTGLAGDTYILEGGANEIDFFAGGVNSLAVLSSLISVTSSADLTIQATKRFHLDGGGDTFFTEVSANVVDLNAGGSTVMEWAPTYVAVTSGHSLRIQTTERLYLDGGNNTSIRESAADTITLETGGTSALDLSTTALTVGSGRSFSVAATQKIFLDGGNNTSLRESAADTITVETGGTDRVSLDTAFYPVTTAAVGSGKSGNTWSEVWTEKLYVNNPTSAAATIEVNWDNGTKEYYRDSSSIRYKTEVRDLDVDTSKIYDLRPVKYKCAKTGLETMGLIAEEVLPLIPELVVKGEDGQPEAIQYKQVGVLIVNELKKIKARLDAIERLGG